MPIHRRAGLVTGLLAAIAVAAPFGSLPNLATAADEPRTLVKQTREYPDRYKRRTVRFVPWGKPSVVQVKKIIRWESQRWGNSAAILRRRVHCESRFVWYASNGPYNGLGQFHASTMSRGLSTMPRGVRVKISRIVRRPTYRIDHYSDGSTRRVKGYRVKVRRARILRGRIRPFYLHGWAQIRIMAMALVGRSAVNDSEWECR